MEVEMRIYVFAVAIVIQTALLAVAQQSSKVDSDVSRALNGMNSQEWTVREESFKAMPSIADVAQRDPIEAERLKGGLIQLLTTENAEVVKTKQAERKFATEDHSAYYGDLIGIVADLNDTRAIPALLGAIATGGMANRGLARLGDKALDAVLTKIQDPDPIVRTAVLFTIRNMLRMRSLKDANSRTRIRDALHSSLEDPEFGVRDGAISAVEYLEQREEFVPVLQKLAEDDPVTLPGTPDDGHDGGKFYPVRQHATELLRKITNHEVPRLDRGFH
jgi:hypothetical protein